MIRSIFKIIIGFISALCIVGFLLMCYVLFYATKDLPDYRQLADYNPPITTRLYSADGKLLAEYAKENRLFVPIGSMPKILISAFLAAEDKNFYAHQGVDPLGIIRAAIHNLAHMNRQHGGSTITQQVVKNFLLTNEKSFIRKVKEAILSFRITKIYSKDRILELYLNQLYLGSGSYGVASAALNYFNKSIDELNIEEVAFLAALPKAPSSYDPRKNYDRAYARRNWVIAQMQTIDAISITDAEQAKQKPITLKKRDPEEVARADFFSETVRREIVDKYGSDTLYGGGLTVHTTLNPKLQAIAEKAFIKKGTTENLEASIKRKLENTITLYNYLKGLKRNKE
jgi:penicillin-binding protein 1A